MKKYLIGIDIGTSGTKSVLFDTAGAKIAESTVEYPLYQPENGWAEQNPEDWWGAVVKTLGELSAAADGEIAGIGLSGQMHSLVMLDGDGEVIRPSILWCDGRTAEECTEIEAMLGRERLVEITANPALCGFTASKILWVKKHEPKNFARCRHILLAKDYIRYKLSGEFVTEYSDASGMQLLDVKNRCWSEEVVSALGINTGMLASLCESCAVSARVSDSAAALTGISAGTPIAGGAGDNAAAAVGMGVCHDGDAFTTIGTSGVVFVHTDEPKIDKKGRIHAFCAAVPGTWHVMGVTQAAGLSLNWFRRNFAPTVSYKELDSMCESLPIGSERLIYLPYLMGERTPLLDPDARGVFFGLSASHSTPHLTRAVIEGVSFSLRSCLDVISEVGIEASSMAICGGGGKSPFWRRMLSDIYEREISVPESDEGAALGAAILAAVAAGIYGSVAKACSALVRMKSTVTPDSERHLEYMKYYRIYKELYTSLGEEFKKLANV